MLITLIAMSIYSNASDFENRKKASELIDELSEKSEIEKYKLFYDAIKRKFPDFE
ncbi:MAG: hypothetical protein Q4D86_08125 [Pasteurella oralis]|nr:hypothetical protein [Pasteurella oralis]